MSGLAAIVAANMAGPSLAPKAKMIGAGAAAVIAGMLSKGCVEKQEPEIEEPALTIQELEQMITDYVEMCCTEHADMHYDDARRMVGSNGNGSDIEARTLSLHHMCITEFVNSAKGDSLKVDGAGVINQFFQGKVFDGQLTDVRLSKLGSNEKINPWAPLMRETSWNLNGSILNSFFSMKDEIE